MKSIFTSVAALMMAGTGAATAADLPAKIYAKAPPVEQFNPWDIAFGLGVASNYTFRGVSQSNRQPSVSAYFEPRYNITKDLQIYAGVAGNSISFTNRASMELDGYVGIRPTFGAASFDFGFWYYGYPGGQCIDATHGGGQLCEVGAAALQNGNFMKKDVSFYEGYAKFNYAFTEAFTAGASVNYSPNFLNFGAEGTYAAVTAKWTVPAMFGPTDVGTYISGEYGRQWLGTTDVFYGWTKLPSYNTWNIGIGFTYKVFTLDIRYVDTDLSKQDCNLYTSDFTGSGPGGSRWCGSTGVVKLSADLTAMQNLK